MKTLSILILTLLILAILPATAFAQMSAPVSTMIADLPTVEEFSAMDADAQLVAYNRTQAAYDAYQSLSEEEKAEIPEAEAIFDALFSHFNAQVMPIGEAAPTQTIPEAPAPRQTGKRSFNGYAWAVIVALAAVIPILGRKKHT